jgi:hypothetical protein
MPELISIHAELAMLVFVSMLLVLRVVRADLLTPRARPRSSLEDANAGRCSMREDRIRILTLGGPLTVYSIVGIRLI